ncbi:hypothetical protein AC579_5677 [Pseudocercospora musae]|uniref:Uncharacterized protein n=1 Tax=Pseudocercospora musae TaxID=113226 RepID=A0A139HCJ3_9PEZI|nr:hypothetical protein AC579_5677 [Pseudocercospora musae]
MRDRPDALYCVDDYLTMSLAELSAARTIYRRWMTMTSSPTTCISGDVSTGGSIDPSNCRKHTFVPTLGRKMKEAFRKRLIDVNDKDHSRPNMGYELPTHIH